jgi:TATA-box binding protein (TBP) (component of TFIID and TFIIIB)
MDVSNLVCTTPTLVITEPRVSTITTTAQLGTLVALEPLYEQLRIIEYWDLTDGVLKVEYKDSAGEFHTKGTTFKDIMLKGKPKKSFFNQLTMVVRREVSPLQWKEVNVKLFRNGGVQLTGVRSPEMAADVLRWLLEHVRATCTGVFAVPPTIHKEQVQLVNTDFSIGAKIHREALFKLLTKKYKLRATYESAFYQGVNTKYFYNKQRPALVLPGLCGCPVLCKGGGDGETLGECKKITISPFQTGQVIITGARTMEQITETYEYVKRIFVLEQDEVLRKVYTLPGAPEPVKAPRASTGWIQHPCPRNVARFPLDALRA